ncbi:UNVERIFIED_CONTAM: hypothetical protein HDU68_004188 [Siphonaria sp. JEL0065]|nr:hypothetical protein HDU68_004188 [Siphonaria sp. JEL0065]
MVDYKTIKRDSFDITTDRAPGSYFQSLSDDHKIYYHIWKPAGEIKAQALYFHGLGEHIERYDSHFSKYADAGILIRSMDWRGHGRTVKSNKDGIQGYHKSFGQVFEDMLQLYSIDIEGVSKSVPTFVFGHSMGGLLALLFAKNFGSKVQNLRGVISQSPAIKAGAPPSAPVLWAIRSLGTFLPKVTQPNELDVSGLNSIDERVIAYLKDPLNHGMISVQLAKDMFDGVDEIKTGAANFKFPLIMYHNVSDRLTLSEGSRSLFPTLGSSDKKFFEFPRDLKLGHES